MSTSRSELLKVREAARTGRPDRVAIIGAGLGGSLMAIYLARRGWEVDIFESRSDLRAANPELGPSMNLGLSRRGIDALSRVGLAQTMIERAIPMSGRAVHGPRGQVSFQAYGVNSSQAIYAVQRNELNSVLLGAAEPLGVRLHFGRKCIGIDKRSGALTLLNRENGREEQAEADWVIGADGAYSTVRHHMQRGERVNFRQDYLEWGWREVRIPAGPNGAFQLARNVFHLWPRGDCMMFAHPNVDGSFCCSCVLPFEGPRSLGNVRTVDDVHKLFRELFPDVVHLVPDLGEQFLASPVASLVSTRVSPWFSGDRLVLLGDACHAVFPFYAQGMNAAFEDCAVLDDCLSKQRDRRAAFAEYQERRKRHTDALADMSAANFVELRDSVRSPSVRLRKACDATLSALFPRSWMPLHALVTHTTIPYADAAERARKQARLFRSLAVGLLLGLITLIARELLGPLGPR